MPTATSPLVQMFPAIPAALSNVRKFISAQAEEAALPGHVADDLLIAVTEACNQLLTHERCSTMTVTWTVRDGEVEILLRDFGVTEHLPPAETADADPDAPFEGALGFPYILEFVDEFDVRPGGAGKPGSVVRIVRETAAG